jgi:hypothetical protein
MITIDNHYTTMKQLTTHRSTNEHFINFHHKVLDVVPGTTLDFRSAKPEATTTRGFDRWEILRKDFLKSFGTQT